MEQSVRRNIFYAFQLIAIIPILGGLVAGVATLIAGDHDRRRHQQRHRTPAGLARPLRGRDLRAQGRLTADSPTRSVEQEHQRGRPRPTTTITPRSTERREPAADGRADLAADDRADGDQPGDHPVDVGDAR